MIEINSWDDLLKAVKIEVLRDNDLPNFSEKEIEKLHMNFWYIIRQCLQELKPVRIPGTIMFYLKKKKLEKLFNEK